MNLDELLTETRYLISDTDSTNPKWSDTILTNRLNTAQVKFVSETDCIKSSNATAPVNIVSGTSQYSLPTDCLKLLRVAVLDANSQWKYLKEVVKEELDLFNNRWEDDTASEPTHYINEVTNNDILLYPKPNFSRASALRSEYVKIPNDLVSTTEALDAQGNLVPFHQTLCFYVGFLCKTDEKSPTEAGNMFSLWTKGVQEAVAALASRYEDRRIINIYETVRHRPLRSAGLTNNPFSR